MALEAEAFRRWRVLYLHVDRDLDLLDRLAHFDQLGRAVLGCVSSHSAAAPSGSCAVVVVYVAEQSGFLCAVNDDLRISLTVSRTSTRSWDRAPGPRMELQAWRSLIAPAGRKRRRGDRLAE